MSHINHRLNGYQMLTIETSKCLLHFNMLSYWICWQEDSTKIQLIKQDLYNSYKNELSLLFKIQIY